MALKLRATRPPRARLLNDSSCAPAHNTPLPLERSPPGSFKRLLGRIRSRRSATRRADQTPHKTNGEAERSRNEDAEQRALIGARGYDHRADEPEEESDGADAQRKADRTLAAPPPVSEGAVPNDGPERCDWYERED